MKLLSLIFASIIVASPAAESVRTWTDTKGRKVEGTLVSKTEKTASVLLKTGKRAELNIADLSEADQDYIAKAEVFPEAKMVAKTVTTKSDTKGTQRDARNVEVSISEIHGRQFEVTIKWLGPSGSTVGVYKTETKPVDETGKVQFSVIYKGGKSGSEYKGYAVGLREKGCGIWAATSASQKPFERFLFKD